MLSITLPLPPSTNRIWRVARGRIHRSTEYLDWIETATRIIRDDGIEPNAVSGRYWLSLAIPFGDRADADNRLKATSDLLVKLKLVPDDRYMDVAYVMRFQSIASGLCRVRAAAISEPRAAAPGGRRPEVPPVFSLPAGGMEAAPS